MVSCELGGTSNNDSDSHGNSTESTGNFRIPDLYVALAFGAALLSILIALLNIYKHLRNYNRPEFQKSLIRILFIVPVYAVFSWLSLAIPAKSLIFESIRDVWEAVVIYEFLKLVLAYCGGESQCLLVIMKHPGSVDHMWPFNYCFRPIRLDARFMRICKRFTLQFVIIKPIMAAVNIGMLEACMYTNSLYSMSQLIIYNISYSFSLYGLVLFYLATHHHPALLSRKPLLKFLAIKTIIFATYYQGLLVQLVPGFDRHYLEALNNFIFCWEMIVFSLVHIWAFGWFEFVGGSVENGMGHDQEQGGGIGDVGHIVANSMSLALHQDDLMEMKGNPANAKANTLQGNVKDAFNMVDVVGDTIENFDTKYESHVRLDTADHAGAGHHHEEDDEQAHNPFQAISPSKMHHDDGLPMPVHNRQVAPSNSSAHLTQPNPFQQQGQSNPFQDDLANI